MFTVYEIKEDKERLYVGITKDMKQREYAHNWHMKRGTERLIYNYLRNNNCEGIKLIPIKQFTKRVEAKRYECYLILKDYFDGRELLNKVPNISDR